MMSGLVYDGPLFWPDCFRVRFLDGRVLSMAEIKQSPDFSSDVSYIQRFRQRAQDSMPDIRDGIGPIYPAHVAARTLVPFFERFLFAMFGLMSSGILWNPEQLACVLMCAFGDFRFYADSMEAISLMRRTPVWCHEMLHELTALFQFEVTRFHKFCMVRMPTVRNDVMWSMCPEVTGLKARVQYLEEELKKRDEIPFFQPESPPLLSLPSTPDLLVEDNIARQFNV